MEQVVHGASCPWGEMSLGQNVRGAKYPWGEMSWGKLSWGELSWGELSVGRVVLGRVVRELGGHLPMHYTVSSRDFR
jgi:hypothetical protein